MNKLGALAREPAFRRTLGYYWLMVCMGLNMAVVGPTLPALAAQTRAALGHMGQLFLWGAVGSTLGTVLGGRLFDRWRGHVLIGAAQLVSALMLLSLPFWPTLGLMLAAAFLKGIMDGIINNGANTLLVWTHREKVSPYMSGLHFCFGLGSFMAPLLVAQVVEIPGAYRWVYVGLGAQALLAGLRLITMPGSPRAEHPAEGQPGPGRARPMPASVVAAMAFFLFCYVGAELALGGWIFTYAVELKLAAPAQAAWLNSGFWLAFTLARLLSVPAATRFSPRVVIAAALAGGLLFVGGLVLFGQSPLMLWVAALGAGFCFAPIYASVLTLGVEGFALSGKASGIILLGDSFGAMVLPWLVGQVLGLTGPRALAYLVFGSLILNLLAFAGLLRARAAALPQPSEAARAAAA